jgi:hypothetical protein
MLGFMLRYQDEFDLLFPSVDFATGERARDLLAVQRIPSMLRSSGFDADAGEEGGRAADFQLFVPKGARDEARQLLNETWGAGASEALESRA